jgi:acyl-coenzyme A synthetase/AMP-(fatty) acid ligase
MTTYTLCEIGGDIHTPSEGREEKPTVTSITTATRIIERQDNQHFCCTPKAWELWQSEPAKRIKRWDRKYIFWIIEENHENV